MNEPARHVSHEAIYAWLYALPRGELRRELIAALRKGHAKRLPRSRGKDRRGQISDMTGIQERPVEVEGRLVPGHWEGDLLKGAGNRSAVGTPGRAHQPLCNPCQDGRDGCRIRARWIQPASSPCPRCIRKTLTYGPGQGNGPSQGACKKTQHPGLFCRPVQPVATGNEREHERPHPPVSPEGIGSFRG